MNSVIIGAVPALYENAHVGMHAASAQTPGNVGAMLLL